MNADYSVRISFLELYNEELQDLLSGTETNAEISGGNSKNIGKSVKLMTILPIVGLNYLMLLSGYLGETGVLSHLVSLIPGFGAFFVMFYLIYVNYVKPVFSKANYNLFYIYLGIWSLYGVVFMFNEEYKNIFTNILDAIAKSGLGLGLWVYYTKIITL